MKITGQQPPEFHGVKGGTGKDNQKAAEREGTLTGSGEPPVKTSTFVMNKIKSLINSEPEVRTDRVAELKDRIKSGEFKVDSEKLAKNMLEDAFQEDIS
jgi:flagellar biosynthesis anti-sigma factor FlgM